MPRRLLVSVSMLGLGAVGGTAHALEAHVVAVDVPSALVEVRPEPPLAAWIEAARRVTVRVGDPSGASGSGTFVSNEGHVLTALHVIEGLARVVVTTPDGVAHRARVLHRDEARDLALLDLDTATPDCVTRAAGDPHDPWLVATGFAGALEGLRSPSITIGMRLGPEPLPADAVVVPRELASLHVAPGMSGGPVLDARGRLVGIVVAMGRFAPLAALDEASPLSRLSCDAAARAAVLPAVIENQHHEPDRDASLAATLPPLDPTLAGHTVEIDLSWGVVLEGVVVAPELVLTLATPELEASRARVTRPDTLPADVAIELVATDGELALVRIPGLASPPIALRTGRSRAQVGGVLRGAITTTPGVIGALDQRPGHLRPFVPTPPGRHCGTLLAMRHAASPNVVLAQPVLAHDAVAMRGELLVDDDGMPRAIHVGHHTSGLGYAVDLVDALARFGSLVR